MLEVIEWFIDRFFREDNEILLIPQRSKVKEAKPIFPKKNDEFKYPVLKIGSSGDRKSFVIDTEEFKNSGMRIGIFAQSGAGKSNTTGVIVEELLKQDEIVIIFDFEGEWHGLRSMFKTVMVVGGDNATVELGHDPDEDITEEAIYGGNDSENLDSRFERILTAILEDGVSAVFDLSDYPDPAKQILFSAISDCLFRIQQKLKSTVLVVVDEAAVVAPEGNGKASKSKLKSSTSAAIALASRGRKRAIDILWASQRTAQVSKTVIGQCDLFLFGKVSIKQDFEPIRHFVLSAGITFEHLKKLDIGQFYLVYKGTATLINVRKMVCDHKGSTPERVKRKRASQSEVALIEKRLS